MNGLRERTLPTSRRSGPDCRVRGLASGLFRWWIGPRTLHRCPAIPWDQDERSLTKSRDWIRRAGKQELCRLRSCFPAFQIPRSGRCSSGEQVPLCASCRLRRFRSHPLRLTGWASGPERGLFGAPASRSACGLPPPSSRPGRCLPSGCSHASASHRKRQLRSAPPSHQGASLLWTAPAERSDDGAFAVTRDGRVGENRPPRTCRGRTCKAAWRYASRRTPRPRGERTVRGEGKAVGFRRRIACRSPLVFR